MKNIMSICFCLCLFPLAVHAGNRGYLVGGPAGIVVSVEAEPINISAQGSVQGEVSLEREVISARSSKPKGNIIKRMDGWLQENLW